MNYKLLLIILIFLLTFNQTLAADSTIQTIKQGERTVIFKEINFKDVAEIHKTLRPSDFTENLNPAYSGGKKDTGEVLALRFDTKTKDIGAISHGYISTIPPSTKYQRNRGTKIKKYSNRQAQFEYYPENILITADQIKLWHNTIQKDEGPVNQLKVLIGKNAIFEQNGFRISCRFNSPCMSLRIMQYPDGKQIASLNIFSYAYLHKINNGKESETTKRRIEHIAGLRILEPTKNNELILAGIPLGYENKKSIIGELKFKSKGVIRYEESFSSKKVTVIANNLAILDYPDLLNLKTADFGSKKSFIQVYSGGIPSIQLDHGELQITKSENLYAMCSYREENCINLDGKTIRVNLPGKSQSSTIKILAPWRDYFKLYVDNLESPSKLYAGRGTQGGKLLFTPSDVTVQGSSRSWQEYHLSFSINIQKNGKKHLLVCDAKKGQCTVDGKQTLKQPNLKTCSISNWCGDGERCVEGICTLDGTGCKPQVLKGSSFSKIDLLIIGDGYPNEKSLMADISKFIHNGLFQIKPFRENRDKFNIHTLIYSSDEIPRTSLSAFSETADNTEIEKIRSEHCSRADYVIVLNPIDHYPYRYPYSKNIYIPTAGIYASIGKYVISHEFGHAFADLKDEYYRVVSSGKPSNPTGINCIKDENTAKKTFNSLDYTGCGGSCLPNKDCSNYYKPSQYSIMAKRISNGPSELDTFNTISSRAIISGLRRYS